MKIKYFAWIKDITINEEEQIDSKEINSLNKLKKFIISKYPELKKHLDQEILRFAVAADTRLPPFALLRNLHFGISRNFSAGHVTSIASKMSESFFNVILMLTSISLLRCLIRRYWSPLLRYLCQIFPDYCKDTIQSKHFYG